MAFVRVALRACCIMVLEIQDEFLNAISVEKPFEGRWTKDENICQTCHTCVEVCPANAIFNKKAKSGERVEKISHRPDACIYCGACAVSCPVNAIDVRKTAILPDVEKKSVLEKKILEAPVPEALLRTYLETDENECINYEEQYFYVKKLHIYLYVLLFNFM